MPVSAIFENLEAGASIDDMPIRAFIDQHSVSTASQHGWTNCRTAIRRVSGRLRNPQ